MSFNKHYYNFRKAEKYPQEDAESTLSNPSIADNDPYYAIPPGTFVNPSQRRAGGRSTFVSAATELPATTGFKDYNLPASNAKMLVTLLNVSILTKQPMLVYGDAGIGKSDIIRQTARAATPAGRKFVMWKDIVNDIEAFLSGPEVKKSYVLFDMRASEYLPEDIRGIPDINSTVDFLRYKAPAWVKWCTHPDAAGVLFFDELNRGITPTLNSLLQITLDRVIVEKPVAKEVAMLAAANLGSEFNGTSELDPALRNRFSQGAYVADPDSWIEYAMKNGVHPDVIDFVRINSSGEQKSGNFNAFYQVPSGPEDQAFVSPRALVLFSNTYKKIHELYDKAAEGGKEPDANHYLAMTETAAAQYCGRPWAVAFATFVRNMALFDLDDLAYKTETQTIAQLSKDPKTGHESISTINSYVGFVGRAFLYNLRPDVRSTPEGIKNLINLVRILSKFSQEGVGQIHGAIQVAMPGSDINNRKVLRGHEFLSLFFGGERNRYTALQSAASQLKMDNEQQIDAFIKGMYSNAKLDEREMDNVLDTFKNLLSKNKGNGAKSFEELNAIIPGVIPSSVCENFIDIIKDRLGPAANKSKERKKTTKFSTFG